MVRLGLNVLVCFGECYIISPTFISSEEKCYYRLVQFFSAFHRAPLTDKPRLTPVSFVKTTVHWPP